MTVNKRKKNSRQRGSWTHGWGSKKKHRGAGNRGGVGNAGTGKRGDAKKPVIWKNRRYFGKYGFKKKGLKEVRITVNLRTLQENIPSLLTENMIKEDNGTYIINLEEIGANKLLGSGKVTQKMKVIAPYASAKAIQKLEDAGCAFEQSGKDQGTSSEEKEEVSENSSE